MRAIGQRPQQAPDGAPLDFERHRRFKFALLPKVSGPTVDKRSIWKPWSRGWIWNEDKLEIPKILPYISGESKLDRDDERVDVGSSADVLPRGHAPIHGMT